MRIDLEKHSLIETKIGLQLIPPKIANIQTQVHFTYGCGCNVVQDIISGAGRYYPIEEETPLWFYSCDIHKNLLNN